MRGIMARNVSFLLVFTAIFLSLTPVSADAEREELPGLDVYVVGNHAYVAGGAIGLYVIDISRPANLKQDALLDTPGDAKGVYAIGSFAYVADGLAGLQIVDIHINKNGFTLAGSGLPSTRQSSET